MEQRTSPEANDSRGKIVSIEVPATVWAEFKSVAAKRTMNLKDLIAESCRDSITKFEKQLARKGR